MVEITLKDLPKISLNKWYSSTHWTHRTKIKNIYKIIIKSQYKHVFSSKAIYDVEYDFLFKTKPLDATNCVSMVKLIEDVIFEDDNYRIIRSVRVQSRKGKEDSVNIKVNKYE